MACRLAFLVCFMAFLSAGATPVAADPKAWLHASQGTSALMRGQHAAAITAYEQALKSDDLPDYGRANILNNRGVANWRLGRHKAAIRDYNAAISIFPDDAQAYNNRGIVVLQLGEPLLALEDFDRAIALAPSYGAAFYNRGNAYYALGDYEAALQAYGKAVRLMPGNPVAHRSRGKTQTRLKRPFAAMRHLSHAIALNPNYMSSYRDRGDAFLALERYADAIADYGKVISRDPGDAPAYLGRARAYGATRKYVSAVKDLKLAIDLDPRFAAAIAERGRIRLLLGNLEGAKADLSEAIAIDPRHARALTHRARVHLRQGSAKQALADANAALSVLPEDAEALAQRGEIHDALFRPGAAVADYRHALRRDPTQSRSRSGLERLTGEVPDLSTHAEPLHPAVEGWVVTRSASGRYVATHPSYPKVRAPLEMYGSGQPRVLAWSLLEKPIHGIGLLRYEAGALDERKVTRSEYVAIVDLWRNRVVAIEPHSWGLHKATWAWTQVAAVVTDPDGMVSTIELRKPVPIARPSQPPAVGGYRSRGRWRASRGATFFRDNFGN